MKTPSFLLLALAVALPSLSAAETAGRCTKEGRGVLDRLVGGWVPNAAPYLKTETAGDAARASIDLAKAPDLCDASVWRYFVKKGLENQEGWWRDATLKDGWTKGSLSQQAEMVRTVDDLYKEVDARGLRVLSAADAVTAAAVKLGVAARADGAAPAVLATAGVALAKFANTAPYTVSATASKTSPSPADLKASLSFLLADPPAPAPAKKGAKPAVASKEPVLGPGVLEFRKEVIGLASELAASSAQHRFYGPAGAVFAAPAMLKGKDGKEAYPDSVAADDGNYSAALKYLTDPAITDAADEGDHADAALSRLDLALRNLIALRAAAVDQAVAAAKKSLNGVTVKAALAGAAHDSTVDPAKVPVPPKGSLAAEVLEKLKGTSEYSELSKIYDNNKDNPKGVEARKQMTQMEADAAATTVGKVGKATALQFTIGGQKVTDTGIMVAELKTDKDYRAFIANSVAQNIAGDGKLQAALAALRGQGDSGTVITPPLNPAEKVPAGDLEAPVKAPAPAESSWEALAKATPGAGIIGWIFGGPEVAERYAAHQNEEAARIAADAARARDAKQAALNRSADAADRRAEAEKARKLAAAAAQAAADEEKIRKAPQDPDLSAKEADRLQKEAIAAREKAAAEQKAKIEKEAADARAARAAADAKALKEAQEAAAKAKAESDAKLKALDETVDKAYTDGVAKAEAALHADYKKQGSDRRESAEKESGYAGSFYRVERVDKFFGDTWEGDKLPAATAACKTKLGFKMPVGSGAGFKDPSADNVDGMCGVHSGLVTFLSSFRGTVKGPAAPAKK